ncbi:MAG TPA: hypothetical protein VL418_02350 [Devosiaceae bacterium]|nr:hypothetical protein [Devosiaceae bacterium]
MKVRFLVAGLMAMTMSAPAFAATYYVVQKPGTTTCTIVTAKPAGKTTMVGTYSSRTKATAGMKGAAVCKSSM